MPRALRARTHTHTHTRTRTHTHTHTHAHTHTHWRGTAGKLAPTTPFKYMDGTPFLKQYKLKEDLPSQVFKSVQKTQFKKKLRSFFFVPLSLRVRLGTFQEKKNDTGFKRYAYRV